MHFTAKRAGFTLMERPFLDLPVFALQGRSVQCLRPGRETSFVRAAKGKTRQLAKRRPYALQRER